VSDIWRGRRRRRGWQNSEELALLGGKRTLKSSMLGYMLFIELIGGSSRLRPATVFHLTFAATTSVDRPVLTAFGNDVSLATDATTLEDLRRVGMVA
jgi:hypothetical protein